MTQVGDFNRLMAQKYCTMKMGAAGEHLLGCQIQNSSNIPCMAMTFSVSAKRLKFTDDFINLVSGFNWILC